MDKRDNIKISIKKTILTALFAALTCVATTCIRIPVQTTGYVHPGDAFVILSGLILGPVCGAFAGGLGSALSDFIGGYIIYVPATFTIKALCSLIAGATYRAILRKTQKKAAVLPVVISSTAGEIFMIFGYFIFEIFMLAIINETDLKAGLIAAAAGLIPNLAQGIFGAAAASILHPMILKVSRRSFS